MTTRRFHLSVVLVALVPGCGCRSAGEPSASASSVITVAAAANLADSFADISAAFTRATGIRVAYSYGATTQLAQQIENGAPFDLFAAADTEHVAALDAKGKLLAGTRAAYARGRLALWVPKRSRAGIAGLHDLASPAVRYLAVANPVAAPYGVAAIQALKAAGLWRQVESKVVYATNISMAKQLAASGNADAALTAYSLVLHEPGSVLLINEALYSPIDQQLAVVSSSTHPTEAKRFASFVLGPQGQKILSRYGYRRPGVSPAVPPTVSETRTCAPATASPSRRPSRSSR